MSTRIVVNAGDGTHEHPTQALLDAYSIRERFGEVAGKRIVIVGDILHSRVALSNIFALNMLGAEVKVCGPKSLLPKHIESLGVTIEPDLKKALSWCDAANMLRVQNERMDKSYFPSIREYTQLYGLTLPLLKSLRKEITILHPGPMNRGVEISSDVADSEQAIILDQVENGVAIRMAVIYLTRQLNSSSHKLIMGAFDATNTYSQPRIFSYAFGGRFSSLFQSHDLYF